MYPQKITSSFRKRIVHIGLISESLLIIEYVRGMKWKILLLNSNSFRTLLVHRHCKKKALYWILKNGSVDLKTITNALKIWTNELKNQRNLQTIFPFRRGKRWFCKKIRKSQSSVLNWMVSYKIRVQNHRVSQIFLFVFSNFQHLCNRFHIYRTFFLQHSYTCASATYPILSKYHSNFAWLNGLFDSKFVFRT